MSNRDGDRAWNPRSVAAAFEYERDAVRCVAALEAAGIRREQIHVLRESERGPVVHLEPASLQAGGSNPVACVHLVEVDVPGSERVLATNVLLRSSGSLVR